MSKPGDKSVVTVISYCQSNDRGIYEGATITVFAKE